MPTLLWCITQNLHIAPMAPRVVKKILGHSTLAEGQRSASEQAPQLGFRAVHTALP
jgi:hypothetical protein